MHTRKGDTATDAEYQAEYNQNAPKAYPIFLNLVEPLFLQDKTLNPNAIHALVVEIFNDIIDGKQVDPAVSRDGLGKKSLTQFIAENSIDIPPTPPLIWLYPGERTGELDQDLNWRLPLRLPLLLLRPLFRLRTLPPRRKWSRGGSLSSSPCLPALDALRLSPATSTPSICKMR